MCNEFVELKLIPMMKFTFKLFLMACIVSVAGLANGQVKLGDYPTIGQTYVKDADSQSATLTVSFNTDQATSTWAQINDTTVEFSWGKARTNKGFAVTVWEADSANAATVNPNDDFRVRSGRWRSNENPNHVASVDSMQALLAKWEEVYAGTEDSAKNTLNNPSACVFDVNGDPANQAYGVHPGIYKKLEHEIVFTFKNMVLTSDLEFTIDTYDEGNTGLTTSYDFGVKGKNGIDTTITDFYVSGSGLKQVKLAEVLGVDISEFNGDSELHLYFSTDGTGTSIAEGSYDPTIVFDDFAVTFAAPVWVEPDMGLDGGTYANADNPVSGVIGEETLVSIPLKVKGRVASLKIEDNLYKNGKGEKYNKMLTFLDTLGIMANDGSGNYTVEVPYTYTPAVFNQGTMEWSNQNIEIAAPEQATDDDLMFYLKVLPEAASYYSNMEIDAGVRVFYQLHVQGTGANIIDLTGVEDGYNLADTLANIPDSASVILAPGKTYNASGHNFDKSVEFRSDDPDASDMPHIWCGSNFDMVEGASVAYLAFRNIRFSGEFDGDYIVNISNQSSVGDFVLESCKVKSVRGVMRIKDNPSTINNFIVNDCVMDSVNNYGLLTMDKAGGAVNDITITNSTFSHFVYFIVSKGNSNSLYIEKSTFYAVPEKGRQLIRYREDGADNIINGMEFKKSVFGHGWNMSGDTIYGIKGFDGLGSTPIKMDKAYATSDFSFSSDTIPGMPSHTFDESSYELWVDPMMGNFNYLSESNANKGVGDPRWVYEDTTTYLLYAGAGPADAMELSDSLMVDYLMGAGYNVKYVDDNDIGVAGYDYSSYEALIIGESSSSSKVVPFGKDDNYPIPLVSMEGFGVKTNKWGWLTDDANFQESRSAVENMEMKILSNTHYITQNLEVDQVVTLSTADPSGDIYAWGLGLAADMPGAIPLGQNANAEITEPMLWAIPRGSSLGASGQSAQNRMVIFAANAKGLDASTSDFNILVERSLEWVLGAGPITSAKIVRVDRDVTVYPNPATNYAKVRFSLDQMQEVSLSLFNMLGQKIEVATPQIYTGGTHEIDIRTQGLNRGMYIYMLKVGNEMHNGKLNIMK